MTDMLYEVHFRATYHGMRTLIEACEGAGDGIEFVGAMPVPDSVPPVPIERTRRHGAVNPRPARADGRTGEDVVRELIAKTDVQEVIHLTAVQEVFKQAGFNWKSASTMMTWAHRAGLVERIGHGNYRRVPGRPL